MRKALGALLVTTMLVAPAIGQETITYSYDALARLTHAARSGGVNNGATTSYAFDKVGNRVSASVAGVTPPSFAVTDASVTEGGALTFTITRSGSTGGSYSVNYATAAGTAASGTDFTAASGTLTFAANELSKTVSVSTAHDFVLEPDETMSLSLSGATGGATIADGQGIGGIVNDDYAPPSFSINDVSVAEGGALVFTVTKVGTTNTSYSVNYASAAGSGASGVDFTAVSGTLIFATNETTKTITVPTTQDSIAEAGETVSLNLSGATGGATLADGQGLGNILDDDSVIPSFTVSDASVAEGGALVFTITKLGANAGSFSINYATASGSAVSGSDFTAASGTLAFAANETTKTVTVSTIQDFALEAGETMSLNLSGATGGATVADGLGIGTIGNDDYPPPSFSINGVSVTEGGALTFTISKTGTANTSYSVNYAAAGGSATVGTDFTALSGTLAFSANEISKTVTIATVHDFALEIDETMALNLSGASNGAGISDGQGVGTILNDDYPPPSFSINDVSVTEGGALTFTITKIGATNTSYSVHYGSASGTAASGIDFTPVSGTLTFAAGETSKTVTIYTAQESEVEGSETLSLNLSAAGDGSTIADSQGIGAIVNDDSYPPPSFTIGHASVSEGGTLVFTITKTGTTDTSYSVDYATGAGTATSGLDFTPASGTLTFAAHETSRTVPVGTIDDATYEADETLTLNLSAASGGATITGSQGVGTIVNNDVPNQPPSTVADYDGMSICDGVITVNVVANDRDPEGNYPLSLVSVTTGTRGYAYVGTSTDIFYEAGSSGTETLTYTVQDSLGAQSTGTLHLSIGPAPPKIGCQ